MLRRGWIFRGGPGRPEDAAVEAAPVDQDLVAWVSLAGRVADRLGPGGSLAVALLGETLARGRPAYWFGYEPDEAGLRQLMRALHEPDDWVGDLVSLESRMAGRRVGEVPAQLRAEWQGRLAAAATAAREAGVLPPRDAAHLAAEAAWRQAAAEIDPGRANRLDPASALAQIRWYPGCSTRTFIGYSDPLNLSTVYRIVREHHGSAVERQALARASDVADAPVDATSWRLSSLRFAMENE